MRYLPPAVASLLASSGSVKPITLLVRMDLGSTVRLCTAGVDVEYGGYTWLGAGRVGAVDPVEDSSGERKGLRFTLSGVPSDQLALALSEATRGKRVMVYEAIFDPSSYAVAAVPTTWSGTLEPMVIAEPADPSQSSVITVSAEHRGSTFAKPKPLRYTDVDQQKIAPGDRCMQFLVSQANHQDVWPAAAWFKQ